MVKLKRARNSFLNISKLPPEILGNIFHWNVAFNDKFGGLERESHNFLSVCYHWSKVASHTPELWSFWGNTLGDWARWYRRSETAPLDLVLDEGECYGVFLDATLRSALQDRATADRIRRVHITADNSALVTSIIASLTAECEGIRSNRVESLVLRCYDEDGGADLSDFFAHYHFPTLRRLNLTNCATSSWDHLTSRTGALAHLMLSFGGYESGPTTSQLLSILASNPILQKLTLCGWGVPDDGGGKSSFRVPLYHLKKLKLTGDSRDVIRFLYRLDYPTNMDRLTLNLEGCTTMEIPQAIGPYFRDYLRGRSGFQSGLGLFLSFNHQVMLRVGDAHRTGLPPQWMDTFMEIVLKMDDVLSNNAKEKVMLDLIAHAPQEETVYFRTYGNPLAMKNVYARFPNLRTLYLEDIPLSAVFPRPNSDGGDGILLSLQYLFLDRLVVDDCDWSPLTTFLARRASSGNRLDVLNISWSPHMCSEVVESISGVVQKLTIECQNPDCPSGTCLLGYFSP